MARNKSSRSGFSPENVGAGLDDVLEPLSPVPSENDKQSKEINQMEDQTIKEKEPVNLSPKKEETIVESVPESEEITPKPTTSLGDILSNNDSYDKKQTLVYLSKETRITLEALGKIVGKKNGGKSFVVEDALKNYFTANQDYVEEAVKKYGKKLK